MNFQKEINKNKWVKVSFKIEKRRKIEDHSVKVKDLLDICLVKEKRGLFHTLSTFYMTNCREQSHSNKVLVWFGLSSWQRDMT